MNIYQRLAQVRSEVRHVAKREVKKEQQRFTGFSEFIGHDDVTGALQESYIRHGIHREVSLESYERNDCLLSVKIRVSWVNIDDPQDRATVFSLGESIISSSKGKIISDKQSGIALSYACKMAELKCLCLTGDDTPDAEVASPGEVVTEVPDDLKEQLDTIALAFDEGTAEAVEHARSLMSSIASKLPRATVEEFRALYRAAKERVSGDY